MAWMNPKGYRWYSSARCAWCARSIRVNHGTRCLHAVSLSLNLSLSLYLHLTLHKTGPWTIIGNTSIFTILTTLCINMYASLIYFHSIRCINWSRLAHLVVTKFGNWIDTGANVPAIFVRWNGTMQTASQSLPKYIRLHYNSNCAQTIREACLWKTRARSHTHSYRNTDCVLSMCTKSAFNVNDIRWHSQCAR